ncbi:T9SS type A sorting domain-containing protein [Flavobacterium lindanitolerans]|jgi:hypothetical protein|uniref:T9SS type A sorting domain-containing protein n=1 Tax=Flavobacterium lindanitolerans TaxID=428988 RepID=UPI0023F180A6|nr:T9SS type A sorting domain-containing protein [Flavobacterium lindanitolerans]
MKKVILFCLLFYHSYSEAQCLSDITLPTGTFSTALTESSTWIKTSPINTTATIMSSTVVIKLDANDYIELKPGFLANPTTGAFIAQTIDGCGLQTPAKTPLNDFPAKTGGEIVVYPNPSKDVFYIKTDNLTDGIIEVYNTLGVKIFEQKFQKNTIAEINLKNQATQMFLLKIISKNTMVSKRIIKN